MIARRHVPVISVMTPFPVHVSSETSVIAAASMMRGHDVRHLPVVAGGDVVGLVRAADLELATALTASMELPVSRLCVVEPLVFEIDEPLEGVVRAMSAEGHDAAVVLRQGRLAGLVTTADICHYLWRDPEAPVLLPPPAPQPFSAGPPDDGAA
ncbi:MAG: CBS domain-containing protein [Myxococcota bacterium]